jgi:hypothetical protein
MGRKAIEKSPIGYAIEYQSNGLFSLIYMLIADYLGIY